MDEGSAPEDNSADGFEGNPAAGDLPTNVEGDRGKPGRSADTLTRLMWAADHDRGLVLSNQDVLVVASTLLNMDGIIERAKLGAMIADELYADLEAQYNELVGKVGEQGE